MFLTFDAFAENYMKQWSGKDTNQVSRAAYWQEVFKTIPIKSIRSKEVRKAICNLSNEYKKDGAGRQTDKLRSSNTVIRYKAVRYLSDSELEDLLKACETSLWDRLYLLVILAITTGMRKSELINIRWTDIDFDAELAKLADTKNGEPRFNPIPEPAMHELRKFRQVGSGYVFSSPTKPDRPFELRRRWFEVLNKANIKNFRFHDLRHTAASYLVMGGATLHDAAEILGHKSTETTKRYAHLSTQHKSQVAERIMSKKFNQ